MVRRISRLVSAHWHTPDMMTAPLNPEIRETLRALGPDVLATLAAIVLQDTPTGRAGLRTAVATGDGPTLRLLTHRLQGSSSIFGADRLTVLCASFDPASDLAGWLQAIEMESDRVAAALARAA